MTSIMSGLATRSPRPAIDLFLLIGGLLTAIAAGPHEQLRAQPAGLPAEVAGPSEPAAARKGVLIEFHLPISPLTQQYLYQQLDEAERLGADLVVVQIDSPGGTLVESEEIAERLGNLRGARSVAYVPRQALSGAAVIALGCDEIVLHPEAMFGDAGPIVEQNGMFQKVPEKIRSELATRLRKLAERHHRPPALAEAMVDTEAEVYRMQNRQTGAQQLMTRADLEAQPDSEQWEQIQLIHETRSGTYFTASGRRAVELAMAEATVDSREELARRYRLEQPFTVLSWTALYSIVLILNHPVVTGLLFLIGLGALYVEFSAPGIGVGGLLASVCFVLFFWSRFLGGTGQWLDVVLFAAGVLLLMVELFVLPGFGIWGLTGVLMILAGVILAGQKFLIPTNAEQFSSVAQSLSVVVAACLGAIVLAVAITRITGRIPILDLFALRPPQPVPAGGFVRSGSSASADGIDSGSWQVPNSPAIGTVGTTISPLRPAGLAEFGALRCEVTSDSSYLDAGRRVSVVRYQGGRPVVRELTEDASCASEATGPLVR